MKDPACEVSVHVRVQSSYRLIFMKGYPCSTWPLYWLRIVKCLLRRPLPTRGTFGKSRPRGDSLSFWKSVHAPVQNQSEPVRTSQSDDNTTADKESQMSTWRPLMGTAVYALWRWQIRCKKSRYQADKLWVKVQMGTVTHSAILHYTGRWVQ